MANARWACAASRHLPKTASPVPMSDLSSAPCRMSDGTKVSRVSSTAVAVLLSQGSLAARRHLQAETRSRTNKTQRNKLSRDGRGRSGSEVNGGPGTRRPLPQRVASIRPAQSRARPGVCAAPPPLSPPAGQHIPLPGRCGGGRIPAGARAPRRRRRRRPALQSGAYMRAQRPTAPAAAAGACGERACQAVNLPHTRRLPALSAARMCCARPGFAGGNTLCAPLM